PYTSEEVSRIIRRALGLQRTDVITHQELLEIARDLGISPRTIEIAIEQGRQEIEKERARAGWVERRKAGFHRHVWTYAIVNGALFLINMLTLGSWWFQWSLLGWGIGLAFYGRGAYFPTEREVEKGIEGMRYRGGHTI
ncbi:MAG TPA: 2TM domain-containing protein, partial [Candidatus Binatia bacterium]|nr:2TM domain-containing protein [Candidatus Binatia bacterium]